MPVAEPVSRLVASLSPRSRSVTRLALRVLERSAPVRGLSRLSLERRARLITRMESSRLSLRRDLALLAKSLTVIAYGRDRGVQMALGVEQRCEAAGGEIPASRLDPAALIAPEDAERADVVIVGSGAAGAAAARVLAEAGLDVLVLEEGPYADASGYPRDPIDALSTLYRDGGLTVAEGRPAIPVPLGRCVGGTTVINSGTCFHTPGDLLAEWRDEHGIAWATALEEEFESLDRDLLVTPVDAERAGRNAELCRDGADALGAANGPIPRNAGGVTCCGTCPMGCQIDGKQAMHVSELPRAAAAGARIRAGVRVERLIVENGEAVGVEASAGGRRYEARGRAVLLCAGAIGTPEILLRQGIEGRSGQLGRNLHIQPICWVGALHDEPVRGWDGVMQSWYVSEWEPSRIVLEATFSPLYFGAHWLRGAGEDYARRIGAWDRLGIIGVQLADRSSGRVRIAGGRARLTYRLTRDDANRLAFGIARACDVHFAAGARVAYPQVGRLASLPASDGTVGLESGRLRPSDLRLEAFHPMGTARMGFDPARHVVAPTGQFYGVPGLYVADGSVLPTATMVNPMITIMAFARRIAHGLAERLS